jgi:release factor glutamine methyltransferase
LKINNKIKTFNYKDLVIEIHKEVYDPAEDTFLLLESIDINKNDSVYEIGTGCGIIALYCAKQGANVICSDINPIAVELTKKNYLINRFNLNGNLEIRQGNLFSPLIKSEDFDVIIFNPPYLPTKKYELVKGSGWFDIATSGGKSGIDIITNFIKDLSLFLKKDGKAYFIFSSLSNKEKLDNIIKKNRFISNIVNKKIFNDETLIVYVLSKKEIMKE